MKIKEVIVVEGAHDSDTLKKYFDCDTIETHGLALSEEIVELLKEVNEKRGIIIFTDPDTPGNKIRSVINEAIPNAKNAFVIKDDAKTSKKVGIEHASKEVLEEALKNLITFESGEESISMNDMYELGLMGKKESKEKRMIIAKKLHIGEASAKTTLKRLNYLKITKEKINEILENE